MNFPQRLQQAMDEAGLGPNDVAKDIGVRRQSVYRWQQGKAIPRADKQHAIAKLFGVHVEWLMFGAGEQYADYSMIKLLRFLRKEHISESSFLRKTNISKQDFDSWRITNIIPNAHIQTVATIYNINITELTEQDDPTTTRILMPDEDAILQKYKQLSDEQKKAAQTVLDALAEPAKLKHG